MKIYMGIGGLEIVAGKPGFLDLFFFSLPNVNMTISLLVLAAVITITIKGAVSLLAILPLAVVRT